MTNDNLDYNETVIRLGVERDALADRLKLAVAEKEVAVRLGSANVALLAPAIADQIEVRVDGDDVSIVVVDAKGDSRVKIEAGRFASFSVADLVTELGEKYEAVLQAKPAADGGSPADGGNLTEAMKAEAHRRRAARAAPLADEERGRLRAANPWTKQHFNLTTQMKILRQDPALAGELKAVASAAV